MTQKVVRKQDCITAVNRTHTAYTSFTGMPAAGSSGNSNGGGGAAAGVSSSGRGGGGVSARVQISYCYKAPSSLRPVFGEEGVRDKERLYSEAEVAAALGAYAAAQGEAAAGSRFGFGFGASGQAGWIKPLACSFASASGRASCSILLHLVQSIPSAQPHVNPHPHTSTATSRPCLSKRQRHPAGPPAARRPVQQKGGGGGGRQRGGARAEKATPR